VNLETLPEDSLLADALRRVEWEAQRGVADLRRYRAEYVRWGQGPPIVLVHGLGDSWPSWVLPMSLLSRDFECIAYNQPSGRGDGARLRSYRHHHLVEDLFRLIDHLDLDRVTLLGHSYGTTISLRAMATQPERIERGVLVCGFARRPLTRLERVLSWFGRYVPGPTAYLPGLRQLLTDVHGGPFTDAPPEILEYYLYRSSTPPMRAMAYWARELDRTDVRDLVPAVRQPTLLISGEHDPLTPSAHQEYLLQRLPNAVMFQISGCGHFPAFSHHIAMVDAVRRFLAAPPCSLGPVLGGQCSTMRVNSCAAR
jgi:pimeloyl-ACP methyl ester carboxylesterase